MIWHLCTSHCLVYLESSFRNVINDLRIFLTLMEINYSGERSFSKFKKVE